MLSLALKSRPLKWRYNNLEAIKGYAVAITKFRQEGDSSFLTDKPTQTPNAYNSRIWFYQWKQVPKMILAS